ncbi:DMSO reductase [Desulfobacula phenolica]|uniref:Formate-dependent nitrite reductase, membrane component NrfD n=1 Tax=Desulfobacula phenolica TaxID=90732 RepID=A0A1H2JCM2_9BACT|nr:DMSO reductase [Desulfobacula phenolica]SDU53838.1 Formate-dependent nitrite reductase, membrane component NrfD [Desulfobacula phenolica]
MSKQIHELEQIMFPPDGSGLKPYEWMVNPTRQQQWIDDKGIFLWLAFFFSEIGAGLYFVSLFYENTAGLIIGWLITLILGGIIHVLYLGNPFRAWRMLMKPNTSELSRGIWVIGVFAVLGFLQMLTGSFNIVFNFIMGIVCLLIISHGFATMNVIRALPAWSSNMVLPLSIISGVWIGQQLLQFMFAISGSAALASGMEVWAEVFFFAYFLCILLYVWGTYHSNEIGKASVKMQVSGEMLKISLVGVVGLGIVLPLIFTLIMWGGDTNGVLIFLRLACVFAGDLAMRYVIMKSAVYKPLI